MNLLFVYDNVIYTEMIFLFFSLCSTQLSSMNRCIFIQHFEYILKKYTALIWGSYNIGLNMSELYEFLEHYEQFF